MRSESRIALRIGQGTPTPVGAAPRPVLDRARRAEVRRLVTLVRETMTRLTGDDDAISSHIAQAAGRFNALLEVDDIRQLKQGLMVEVGDLQRVAAERQHQWKQAVATFEARMAVLERQLVEVTQEALLDALTGLANRRSFERSTRAALQGSPREFVIALVDLDDFKTVNDLGGHQAGDRVLQLVASTLKGAVRKQDVVARIGGDKFAVLAMGATLLDTEPRLRSILDAFGGLNTGFEPEAVVSASCGMVECCAGDTADSLMRRADQALYEAKRQGRSRLAVKSPHFTRHLLQQKG